MYPTGGSGSGAVTRERWEFRIGAPVYTSDDTLGTLHQVVVDPGSERVSGLIVRAGVLLPRNLLIPLEAVRRASDQEIQLSWSREEARQRGTYDESAFHVPARVLRSYAHGDAIVSLRGGARGEARQQGTTPHGLPPIQVGQRVEALDGRAGRVREVLVDAATGRVTHFVMRHGLLWKQDRLVPVEWVRSVTAGGVAVAATLADLIRLPEYHPDAELERDILHEWYDDGILRPLLAHTSVHAKVRDGVAILQGYVRSRSQKQRLAERALEVPGVSGVVNELVADDELPFQVTEMLANDPRTRHLRLRVESYFGHLRIQGDVPDRRTWEAVAEVASCVPRVRCVINQLRVSGEERSTTQLPGVLLQPRAGQLVRTYEGEFGQVAKVILHPYTRMVSGLVVEGRLPGPDATDTSPWPGEWPRKHRTVVVPAEWIETVTAEEVLLHVPLREAAGAPDYRPGYLRKPGPSWVPPFPYESSEVLIGSPAPVGPAVSPPPRPETQAAAPGILRQGDRVRCCFGPVGTIDHLRIDPETGRIAYLVIRSGEGLPNEIPLPVEWVRRIDAGGVLLKMTFEELRHLTPAPLPEGLVRVEQGELPVMPSDTTTGFSGEENGEGSRAHLDVPGTEKLKERGTALAQ